MKTYLQTGFAGLILAAGWFGIAMMMRTVEAAPYVREAVVHPDFDPAKIDREIKFHEGRVERDPQGAIGWSMLSGAYLAKSREFDSDQAAWEAEAAARKSLSLRRKANLSASNKLTQSLLEQHRFQDALVSAEEGCSIVPGDPKAIRIKLDCLIELGRYGEARRVLKPFAPNDASVYPERARLASLSGDHADALRYLESDFKAMADKADVASETLAWYDVKIASEYLALKRWGEAQGRLDEAIRLHPRSYKACLGLAKLALARKDAVEAKTWAVRAIDISDSMEAKSLLVETCQLNGDKAGAKAWEAKLISQWRTEDARFEALGKGGKHNVRPEDRMFATYCARHGIRSTEAALAASRDMANRPDPVAVENLHLLKAMK